MPNPSHISFNAVRIFAVVARHLSIKQAANELNVTPGAVSHQIKSLEGAIGTPLFERRHKAITLSDAGNQFYNDITPGLIIIEKSVTALQRDANELVLRVSVTLAVRWLIPKLEAFKQQHPEARIRVETSHSSEVALNPDIDLAITYCAPDQQSNPKTEGQRLFKNILCPALSPQLLKNTGYTNLSHIEDIPAINCNTVNWVWPLWSQAANIKFKRIRISHEFDTDDSAIHAAIAGMGMVLVPLMMIKKELAAGSLVALPNAPQIELGHRLLLSSARLSSLGNKLRKWLIQEASVV